MNCSTADVLIKTGTCKQPATHGPNLSARHTDWRLLGLTGFHTDRQADRLAVTSFTRTDRFPHQTDRQADRTGSYLIYQDWQASTPDGQTVWQTLKRTSRHSHCYRTPAGRQTVRLASRQTTETDRQSGSRQTDRQTGRRTDGRTDGRTEMTDRQTDRQADIRIDRQAESRQAVRHMDRQTDRQAGRQQTDRQTYG